MTKRCKRLLIPTIVVVLGAVGWLALRFVTSPSCLKPRIENALSGVLDAECQVEGLSFGLLTGLRIESIGVSLPRTEPATSQPFLRLRGVDAIHSVPSLLSGRYQLKSLRLQDLTLHVTPEVLQWMSRVSRKQEARRGSRPPLSVDLQKGRVEVSLPELVDFFTVDGLVAKLSIDRSTGIAASATFRVNGNLLRTSLSAPGAGLGTTLRVELPDVDLAALPRPRNDQVRSLLTQVALAGHVSGEVSLMFPAGDWSNVSLAGDLLLDSIDLRSEERQWAVEAVRGSCRVTRKGLTLDGVTGHVAGAPFHIDNADFTFGGSGPFTINARGQVRGLDVTDLDKIALPEVVGKVVSMAGLEAGLADVQFDFSWGGGHQSYEVLIDLRQARARPEKAPVPLENLQLQLSITPGPLVRIARAQAELGGGRITATGSVLHSAAGETATDLEFQFTRLPLRDDHVKYLPEGLSKIVQAIGMEGARLDGTLTLRPGDIAFDARLRADRLRSPVVPYTLTDVSCQVRWSNVSRVVRIDDFQALHEKGELSGFGSITYGEGAVLSFSLDGHDLPLDEELRALLPETHMALWDQWHPNGRFSFTVHLDSLDVMQKQTVQQVLARVAAEVRLADVAVRNDKLAIGATEMGGRLHTDGSVIRFSGISGKVLGVEVRADGLLDLSAETPAFRSRFNSPWTQLTPELVGQWPVYISTHLADLQPEGAFELYGGVRHDASNEAPLATQLTVVLHDVVVHVGDTPVMVKGSLHAGAEDIAARPVQFKGTLSLDRYGYGPIFGNDLTTLLSLADNTLTASNLRAQAYGGSIMVDEASWKFPSSAWKFRGLVSNLGLETLMATLGEEGEKVPTGLLRGRVELEGRAGEPGALKGKAELWIDRGYLYELPIIVSVLELFNLRLSRQEALTNAYVDLHVQEEKILLDNVLLTGNSVPVHIRGTVGFGGGRPWKDQPIDLVFTLMRRKGLLDAIPVVSLLKELTVDKVSGYVLQARVEGTVGERRAKTVLEPVTAPVAAMWSLLKKLSPSQAQEYLTP